MFAGGIVADPPRSRRSRDRRLTHFASPKLEHLLGIRQSASAIAASAEGHHSLADDRIGQRFVVSRPVGLKAEPAGVLPACPLLERHFGRLKRLALDDGHLAPRAIEPDVPGNMPRRAAPAAVLLQSMKPVVERVVNFPFDQPAAHPKPANAVPNGPRIDAAWDLMSFKSCLPRLAGVGHN